MKKYIPPEPGDIFTIDGNKVGIHDGLMYYTIGQRKGIGVGGGFSDKEAPWYVVEKDHEKNQLIIAQGHDHPSLYSTALKAVDLHWIHSDSSNLPISRGNVLSYAFSSSISKLAGRGTE